jgi:hypothetical protein
MSRACPRSNTICASISNAATCRNKKRAEGGDHGNVPDSGGRDTRNGRGCHACLTDSAATRTPRFLPH